MAQDSGVAQEQQPSEQAVAATTESNNNNTNNKGLGLDYRVQGIYFEGRKTYRVLQDVGGPCPLIGLCNVMLLRNDIRINQNNVKKVGFDLLTKCLDDHLQRLFDRDYLSKPNVTEDQIANALKNIEDCVKFFPKLEEGLDINIRFSDCNSFEFTPQVAMFDSYNVVILHGWVVDPQDKKLYDIMGNKSYNEVVDWLTNDQYDKSLTPEQIAEIEDQKQLVRNFLNTYSHQLTEHGLQRLHESLTDHQLAILFRNNHFSCIYKHNNILFELCTDEGIIDADYRITWQTLPDVTGDTHYAENDFRIMDGFEIGSGTQHYESKPQSKETSTNPDNTDNTGNSNKTENKDKIDTEKDNNNNNSENKESAESQQVQSGDSVNNGNNGNASDVNKNSNNTEENKDNIDNNGTNNTDSNNAYKTESKIDNNSNNNNNNINVDNNEATDTMQGSDMELDSNNGDVRIDENKIVIDNTTDSNQSGVKTAQLIVLDDETYAKRLMQSEQSVANDLALARAIQDDEHAQSRPQPSATVSEEEKRSVEQAMGWKQGDYDKMMAHQTQAMQGGNVQQMQQMQIQGQGQAQRQGKGQGQAPINQQNLNEMAREQEIYMKWKKKYPDLTFEEFHRQKQIHLKSGKPPPNPDTDECVVL